MGADPAAGKQAELLRVMELCRAAEERRRVEREALEAVLWAGIKVGDYMTLTVDAHVKRGGLLLTDEVGMVRVKQVRIEEIKGEQALALRVEPYGRSTEWVWRGELGEVVMPGLVPPAVRAERVKYWEAS
jgi:hypothetical protein